MSLYQRILGHPFVYDRIRPLVVGGIDWSPLYSNLGAGAEDVILDVGCGTGIAHEYLRGFGAYYGYDTDAVAIKFARQRAASSPASIRYECAMVTAADVARIQPTRIILSGLLHHLADADVVTLLRMCASTASVQRIATSDVVYLRGRYVSNALAYFDRGKFVRTHEAYLELVRQAGLTINRDEIVRSHPRNGRAWYLMMTLAPGSARRASSPLTYSTSAVGSV